ncbi:MAG: 3-phosphoshikimate 1-carboxyvinyltransferase [Ruminococcaceae bacterium]|nr:3-phosphoshikimate 1-carboxyvinyltransferase [Oscillospiraceae bacterium]
MDITIQPKKLKGSVEVIPSKSQAHRYLICAAFADQPTTIHCAETNRDIEATADCLRALGAKIDRTENGYHIEPAAVIPEKATLPCCESGSTLRFLLPVAGALGVDATFQMEGRLPQRPLSPLWEEMERMGCSLSRPTPDTILCTGKLKPGEYIIDGGVSSQFITGLMFAQNLIPGESEITITGRLESTPYFNMTGKALDLFGYPGFHSPGTVTVEGDWSNGAFWLAANALGNALDVQNLNPNSVQGDRKAASLVRLLRENMEIDARDIPDLVPILSIVAATNQGAVFRNIARLRLKESDRVASTIAMLVALGGKAAEMGGHLVVWGTGLRGGTVDAVNDHRIAMSAAIAATVCKEPVTILGAECVQKSYPRFWEEYTRLGGNYELNLR